MLISRAPSRCSSPPPRLLILRHAISPPRFHDATLLDEAFLLHITDARRVTITCRYRQSSAAGTKVAETTAQLDYATFECHAAPFCLLTPYTPLLYAAAAMRGITMYANTPECHRSSRLLPCSIHVYACLILTDCCRACYAAACASEFCRRFRDVTRLSALPAIE